MKKAIAYMRFSSPGQMSGDSLNRQRRLITEWLKVNSDYYLDTVTYEDLGLCAHTNQPIFSIHRCRNAPAIFCIQRLASAEVKREPPTRRHKITSR